MFILSVNNDWLFPLPHSFSETIDRLQKRVIERIKKEAQDKQLYYHDLRHPQEVQQRSRQIFSFLMPYYHDCDPHLLERQALLLDLCAISHDMVQIFVKPSLPHTSRRRESGISEKSTIRELLKYIEQINSHVPPNAQFTPEDMALIEEAIVATVCDYDMEEAAIYQPYFSQSSSDIHLIPQLLALADIGSLAMEGIETYNREGSLLFLEENPDIVPLIQRHKLDTLEQENLDLAKNIRERLLRRTKFQVNFAKSRIKRTMSELSGLDPEGITSLQSTLFPYLTDKTLKQIQQVTPTEDETSLKTLVDFFKFEQILSTVEKSRYISDLKNES